MELADISVHIPQWLLEARVILCFDVVFFIGLHSESMPMHMYGWMDGWMHGCMESWMHGCMDAWMHGIMDAWMHGCMESWMHGCMDVWMYGCMDGWMHGRMYVCMHVRNVAPVFYMQVSSVINQFCWHHFAGLESFSNGIFHPRLVSGHPS